MIIGAIARQHLSRPRHGRAPGIRPARRALGAEDLSTAGKLHDGALRPRSGEILGVAGLQGMGQLELFLACFGMTRADRGRDCASMAAGRAHLAARRDPTPHRHQPGAGGPQDRGAVPEARRAGQRVAAGGRPLRALRPDRRRTERGRRARARAGRGASPRAVYAGRRILRRQPAEDRDRQMAARREPHPAAVRPDARRRRRHQARDLSPDARVRRRRRRDPVPLHRDPRDRQHVRPRAGACIRRHGRRSWSAPRSRRRRSCARHSARSRPREGPRNEHAA